MPTHAFAAVIMAGGTGRRFWPLSIPDEPKQFLRLPADQTMLQAAWQRLDGLVPPDRRLVITAARFAERVRQDLPDLPAENLIGEPEQRDTAAPAILGTLLAQRRWPGATVICLPADHLVEPADAFRRLAVAAAGMIQRESLLVAIGVAPTTASSAYGYIQRGDPLEIGDGLRAFRVRQFTEKPDTQAADGYVRQGTFYWNAGIYLWQPEAFLDEARRYMPEHHQALTHAVQAWATPQWARAFDAAHRSVARISVDYGIMEHTSRAAVVEADFTWSDLGGWLALADLIDNDDHHNTVRGDVLPIECRNTVIYCHEDAKPVICIGLHDMVVVHAPHGVLVCPKDKAEQIKEAVDTLAHRTPSDKPQQ